MSEGTDGTARVRPLTVLVFYGAMAGVALLWALIAGDPDVFHAEDTGVGLGGQAGSGVVLGLLGVLSSRLCARWFAWARRLNEAFRELLGPLRSWEILVMAGCSAVAEEMLFRGAMQETIGLLPTAAIFGLAHYPLRRDLWPWTVWALAAGVLLGELVVVTGSLLGPIIAHFTINWFNLHALNEAPGPGASS